MSISPSITAITEQEPVLTVTAPTHLTAGLLQVQIYSFLLTFLHRLLYCDLNEAVMAHKQLGQTT